MTGPRSLGEAVRNKAMAQHTYLRRPGWTER